jgi:hypothetical protein
VVVVLVWANLYFYFSTPQAPRSCPVRIRLCALDDEERGRLLAFMEGYSRFSGVYLMSAFPPVLLDFELFE